MAREVPKYQKLSADMRKQYRSYRIKVVPMIIGALGTVDTLLEDLRGILKLSKGCSRSDKSDAENCSLLSCKDIEATSIC